MRALRGLDHGVRYLPIAAVYTNIMKMQSIVEDQCINAVVIDRFRENTSLSAILPNFVFYLRSHHHMNTGL